MKVLVACEESQALTIELRKLGVEAYSCDLLPCSGGHPEWHLQQDVTPLLEKDWDMIIAFPPCTYMSRAGARWMYKGGVLQQERLEKALEAKEFFMKFYNNKCKHICIENPIPLKIVDLPKPTQTIEPYYFGEPYSKRTNLWIKGLPKLESTNIVKCEKTWCPSSCSRFKKTDKNKGTKNNQIERSKTFPGIAKAMAKQFVDYLGGNNDE